MNINTMINSVRDFLDGDDWNYDFESENNLIHTGINLYCKLDRINEVISFRDTGFYVYATINMNADEETRPKVMEYITRANYELRLGNFELDLEDGEVRYKVYTNTKGMTELPQEIVEDAIIVPAMMFDRYGDGLATLMMGFSDPATEIEKAEKE